MAIHKQHGYQRKKTFEDLKARVSSQQYGDPPFEFGLLTDDEQLRVGVAGSKGWRGFKWGGKLMCAIVGIEPGIDDGNYTLVPQVEAKADNSMLAAMYWASQGKVFPNL